jgi:hypothetical protein
MSNLLGRIMSEEEYHYYFYNHPDAHKYKDVYSLFSRMDLVAKQIVDKTGQILPESTSLIQSNSYHYPSSPPSSPYNLAYNHYFFGPPVEPTQQNTQSYYTPNSYPTFS